MRDELVPTGFCLFKLATATKVDVTVKCQMYVMKISLLFIDVVLLIIQMLMQVPQLASCILLRTSKLSFRIFQWLNPSNAALKLDLVT